MLEHKIDKNKFVDFCNGDVKGEDTETLNHFDEHTRYQFTRMLYAYGTGMTGQNPFANDEEVEITADIDAPLFRFDLSSVPYYKRLRPDQSARIPDYVDPCPYSLYHSSVSLFDLSKPFFRILQTLPYPIDQISC